MTGETSAPGAEKQIVVSSRANIERLQDRAAQLVASLEVEMLRARRYERPLSMASVDLTSARGGGVDGAGFRQLNLESKLRVMAPKILRAPDFWGRIERLGFVIVLPETELSGAQATIDRFTQSPAFLRLQKDVAGRSAVKIGVAQFDQEISAIDGFVAKARANIVWRGGAEDAAEVEDSSAA